MALHELHARRLSTLIALFEGALDRIGLVLRDIENRSGSARSMTSMAPERIRQVRTRMESICRKLRQAAARFGVESGKPDPRQVLAAELSRLWVILENARPEKMRGYGTQLAPPDREDWEKLIQGLLLDVEAIRRSVLARTDREVIAESSSRAEG